MKKFALVGAVSMLALLASCGGDSDTLSDRDYVRALEDVCSTVNDDLDDLEGPETADDYDGWAELAEDARDIVSDGLDELNELQPPEELEADHEDYVASVERTLDATDDLQAAAEDEDESDLDEALTTLEEENDERNAIAEDIGADECVDDAGEEPTPDTEAPDTEPPDTAVTVPPITESPDTEAPDTVPATQPPATMPPIDMTMPPQTQPPVSGTSIETFDFDNLITPVGYTWVNIDAATLADIQADFDAQFMGQIAALGGARVTDEANGFTFNTFVFFWNEEDIVASGTGINFLNQFTDVASTSSDTFTEAGFPVTIWTDPSGLEGVGVIDSDVSVVMYGPSGTTQPMLTFFDSFILAQG